MNIIWPCLSNWTGINRRPKASVESQGIIRWVDGTINNHAGCVRISVVRKNCFVEQRRLEEVGMSMKNRTELEKLSKTLGNQKDLLLYKDGGLVNDSLPSSFECMFNLGNW